METIDSVQNTIKGFARISNKEDSKQFLLFQITALTNNGGWWTLDVAMVSSTNTPFGVNEDIISFVTVGEKGDTGATGPTGDEGPQGPKVLKLLLVLKVILAPLDLKVPLVSR